MRRLCWLTALWIAASGCSRGDDDASEAPVAGAEGGTNPGSAAASGSAGTAGTAGGAAADDGGTLVGTGVYRVAIEVSRTTVCAGECVELSARAENGHAPYRYEWSAGLGEGAGPHEACPEHTTTFSVVARDTATVTDELGVPSMEASASVEIVVDDDEECEPDPDAGVPELETHELCSARATFVVPGEFYQSDSWQGGAKLAGDGDGNVYVVGTFVGSLELDGQTITASETGFNLVLKYDASCELVWAKVLGEDNGVSLRAVAVGDDGELAVAGTLNGVADFGAGPISSTLFPIGLLVKLSVEDGSVLWNDGFGTLINITEITDIGIDDSDDIVISGHSADGASFGGDPIGGAMFDGAGSFVAKLSSDGAHRYSFAIDDYDPEQAIAVHGSGGAVTAGQSRDGTFAIGDRAFDIEDQNAGRYAARIDAAGELLWTQTIPTHGADFSAQWVGRIAFDREQNTIVEGQSFLIGANGSEHLVGTLTKLGPDGSVLWSEIVEDARLLQRFQPGAVAADSQLNILHVFELDAPRTSADDTVAPGNQVHVNKLSPDGDATWKYVLGGDPWNRVWGIAAAPDDAAWVAHLESVAGDPSSSGSLVVTKLAP